MICHESAHVLPQKIDKTLFDKVHVCDNTNDITQNHNGIFINALSDTMPQCDLKRGVNTLSDIKNGDMCHVYCAQSSCSAAIDHMNSNKDVYSKCKVIHYIHKGAIDMDKANLNDGARCHADILAYNSKNHS
jgi:hypothetical protein